MFWSAYNSISFLIERNLAPCTILWVICPSCYLRYISVLKPVLYSCLKHGVNFPYETWSVFPSKRGVSFPFEHKHKRGCSFRCATWGNLSLMQCGVIFPLIQPGVIFPLIQPGVIFPLTQAVVVFFSFKTWGLFFPFKHKIYKRVLLPSCNLGYSYPSSTWGLFVPF